MKIYFWQNIVSIHQVDLINGMHEKGYSVTLVVQAEIDEFRSSMGWSTNIHSNIELLISPTKKTVDKIFSKKDSVHIFTGFFSYKYLNDVFKIACKNNAKIFIYSESVCWNTFIGNLKLLYKKFLMLLYGKYIHGVLATGSEACLYFENLGLAREKIFEFGYFLDVCYKNNILHNLSDKENILFVGRLVQYKGILKLIDSFKLVSDINSNIHLNIIGDGPLLNKILKKVENYGLKGRVTIMGNKPHEFVLEQIRSSNLLILPNLSSEGWGVVVNEALLNGTPVVVSKYTGSCCVVTNDVLGEVIESVEPLSLVSSMLKKRLYNRCDVIKLAKRTISIPVACDYLETILFSNNSKHLLPPWRVNNDSTN